MFLQCFCLIRKEYFMWGNIARKCKSGINRINTRVCNFVLPFFLLLPHFRPERKKSPTMREITLKTSPCFTYFTFCLLELKANCRESRKAAVSAGRTKTTSNEFRFQLWKFNWNQPNNPIESWSNHIFIKIRISLCRVYFKWTHVFFFL